MKRILYTFIVFLSVRDRVSFDTTSHCVLPVMDRVSVDTVLLLCSAGQGPAVFCIWHNGYSGVSIEC